MSKSKPHAEWHVSSHALVDLQNTIQHLSNHGWTIFSVLADSHKGMYTVVCVKGLTGV